MDFKIGDIVTIKEGLNCGCDNCKRVIRYNGKIINIRDSNIGEHSVTVISDSKTSIFYSRDLILVKKKEINHPLTTIFK